MDRDRNTRCVWKYDFAILPDVWLEMPEGSEVLRVGNQGLTPVLWALVDPDQPKVRREFHVCATGPVMVDPGDRYVGTFQLPTTSGEFVGHLFEAVPGVE